MSLSPILKPVDAALQEALSALERGDGDRAVTAARRATTLAPHRPDAWWVLGRVYVAHWDHAAADAALAEGLRQLPPDHPQRVRFLTQRVSMLFPLGRNADAVALTREALAVGVDDAESLAILGLALRRAFREAEALPLLRRAVELEPSNSRYLHTLADVESFLGLIEEAQANYEAALAIIPSVETYYALARLKRWTNGENHIESLKMLKVNTPQQAAHQGYALFKELGDVGRYDEAWAWLEKGASAQKALPVTPQTPAWSAASEAAVVEAWRAHFPKARFQSAPLAVRDQSPRRIFIIGLPRSGTTLTERILAAHSQVQALGELHAFSAAVKRQSGSTTFPLLDADTISLAAEKDPAVFADFYDRETAYLSDGSPFTIDKLPYNYEYAGLIRLAFPGARIIHVRRNPMDSLFGAYKLYAPFKYRWSYDQNDLADHYLNYRNLMAHWSHALGEGLIEVTLEDIIANPQAEIRRLLDRCGLSFEDACLEPHKAKGAVASASSVQVRMPINAEGVGAWRRYAAQLEPLKQRLMAMGFVDGDGNPLS